MGKAKKKHMKAVNKKVKAAGSLLGGMDSFVADVQARKAAKEMISNAKKRKKARKK